MYSAAGGLLDTEDELGYTALHCNAINLYVGCITAAEGRSMSAQGGLATNSGVVMRCSGA